MNVWARFKSVNEQYITELEDVIGRNIRADARGCRVLKKDWPLDRRSLKRYVYVLENIIKDKLSEEHPDRLVLRSPRSSQSQPSAPTLPTESAQPRRRRSKRLETALRSKVRVLQDYNTKLRRDKSALEKEVEMQEMKFREFQDEIATLKAELHQQENLRQQAANGRVEKMIIKAKDREIIKQAKQIHDNKKAHRRSRRKTKLSGGRSPTAQC